MQRLEIKETRVKKPYHKRGLALNFAIGAVGLAAQLSVSAEPVVLRNGTATLSQSGGWNANLITDGVTNDFAGWAVYDFGRGGAFTETAVVETATNVGFASGSQLTFGLYHVNHNPQHGLGRFRLSYTTDPRETFADGLNSGGDVTANWIVLTPKSATGTGGETFTIRADGSIVVSGPNPTKTVYTITAEVEAEGITGFRLEALEDPSLPAGGPGRYPSNGNFVLTELTASIEPLSPPPPPQSTKLALKNTAATFSQISGWNAGLITDGVTNDAAGWAVYDFGRGGTFAETAVFETETNAGFASGSQLTFALYHVNHNPQHGLGRFRLSYTTDPRDIFADGLNSGGDVTANWVVLIPKAASSTGGETMAIQPDGSILVSGPNPTKTVYTVTTEVAALGITGFRLEALEDPSLPAGGPGRYPSNGNFVLTELAASIEPLSTPPPPPPQSTKLALKNTAATFSQISGWNAGLITDGVTNDAAGWAVYDFGRGGTFSETAVFETETNVGFASGSELTFVLYHLNHNPQSGLGRFRLSFTTDPRDTFADGLNSGGDVTANWVVLTPKSAIGTGGEAFAIRADGSIVVSGPNPNMTIYTVTAEVAAQGITGFRLEALEDPSLPSGGPGRYPSNGNFVLTEIAAEISALNTTPTFTDHNLARDFSPTVNPAGVWSYGAKPSLSGAFELFGIRGLNPFEYWQLVAAQEPTIYRNGTSETITIADGQGVFPPGTTFLYSGTDGATNGFGVARFTAPNGTNYVVTASVSAVYNGGYQGDTDFHIVKNTSEVYGAFLAPADSRTYSNVVALAEGETLDFIVGRGQDGSGTSSGLRLDVTLAPTPIPATPTPPHAVPAPDGLAAWWPLNGNGNDKLGRNNGTLIGSPSFNTGKVGDSMTFDGGNDAVRIASSRSVNVGTREGFTIEGWIFPADLSHLRPLAEWNNGNIGVHFWTGVDTARSGDGVRSLFGNIIDTTGASHQVSSPKNLVTENTWQHVALTYDKASGLAAILHNGHVVAETNLGIFTPDTRGDLYFGNRPSGPFAGIYWKGSMDEMTLYRRALPAADLLAIYTAAASGKSAPINPPPSNIAPVAKALASPLFTVWPDQTNRMIISANGYSAPTVLDGSLSSDADGDSLTYTWTIDEEGTPFAATITTTNSLSTGLHRVTLLVDDGEIDNADTIEIEVITLDEALDEIYGAIIESNLLRKDKRPLFATLDRVSNAFDDWRLEAGIRQLHAFQQKVRAQVGRQDPDLSARLQNAADQVIEAVQAYLDDHEDTPKDDGKGTGI